MSRGKDSLRLVTVHCICLVATDLGQTLFQNYHHDESVNGIHDDRTNSQKKIISKEARQFRQKRNITEIKIGPTPTLTSI
jgi:hypothetical protein